MSTQLKKAPKLDYSLITATVNGGELRRLMESIRNDVETYYRGSFSDNLSSMNAAADAEERKKKEQAELQMTNKRDDELIAYMKGREDTLVEKSVDEFVVRLANDKSGRVASFLRNNIELLIKLIGSKDQKIMVASLKILSNVLDDKVRDSLKKLGAIRPIAKLLADPALAEDESHMIDLLYLISVVVTTDENRDLFRTVNGMSRLPGFLVFDKNPEVSKLVTTCLVELSCLKENQLPLVKAGVLEAIFNNLKAANNLNDGIWKRQCMRLIQNLSQQDAAKEVFTNDDMRDIVALLNPAKLFQNQNLNSPEASEFKYFQMTIISALIEITQIEKNQRAAGQLGIIKILEGFFFPISDLRAKFDLEILFKVLKLLDNLVKFLANRNQFLENNGATTMAHILSPKTHRNFLMGNEPDILVEAASVLTTLTTKATMHQQAYQQLGVQTLLKLLPSYPNAEELTELTSLMISVASSKGINAKFLLENQADRLLINFIKNSKDATVLVNACDGLGYLCSEPSVVEAVIQSNIITILISLLRLDSPVLCTNVAKVLAAVADGSETGPIQIVSNGGIAVLVSLLDAKQPNEVKEQSLLTFGKVLFSAQNAQENINYFFMAKGEKPLLECLFSVSEEVQVPAASIVHGLTQQAENRQILRNSNIEEKLAKLETHKNVVKPGSQVANYIRLIKVHMKKDAVGANLDKTAELERKREKRALPKIWMKVVYEYKAKIMPIKEGMQWVDFIEMLTTEFGIRAWNALLLNTTLAKEEIKIVDQNRLDFLIACIQKDELATLFIHTNEPTIAYNPNSTVNKLDGLLSKLDHIQLRNLIKMAVDQNIDMTGPIRSYMNINRNCFDIWKPVDEPEEEAATDTKSTVSNRKLPSKAPPLPAPPQLKAGSNRVTNATASANQEKKGDAGKSGDGGDLMDALKAVVLKGGGLKKTDLDENEREKRGMEPTAMESAKLKATSKKEIQEREEEASKIWIKDENKFIELLQDAFMVENAILNIVFQTVDNDMMEWKDAKKLIQKPINDNVLAKTFLNAGMNLKYQIEDGNESNREYVAIQCPADLPRWIVLKTIQSILSANGIGEGPKAQGEVIQGYWSKKNKPPIVVGSLWG